MFYKQKSCLNRTGSICVFSCNLNQFHLGQFSLKRPLEHWQSAEEDHSVYLTMEQVSYELPQVGIVGLLLKAQGPHVILVGRKLG